MIDQFYDRTKQSATHTFFGEGIVAHVPFAKPVCPELAAFAAKVSEKAVAELLDTGKRPAVHRGGTYVNMEGPAFSTAAAERPRRRSFNLIIREPLPPAKSIAAFPIKISVFKLFHRAKFI